MKYLIITIFGLAAIAAEMLVGCEPIACTPDNLNDMKKPCIVVAVKKRDPDAGFHGGYGSIIIKDAAGAYVTFSGNTFEGGPLIETYKTGDTIR